MEETLDAWVRRWCDRRACRVLRRRRGVDHVPAESQCALAELRDPGYGICCCSVGLFLDAREGNTILADALCGSGAGACICIEHRLYHDRSKRVCGFSTWAGGAVIRECLTCATIHRRLGTFRSCDTRVHPLPTRAR